MCAAAGTGTFHRARHSIPAANFAQGIHILPPRGAGGCFMVIKIKNEETAGVVRQQGIDTDHVAAIGFFSGQMRHQYALIQRRPLAVWAGRTLDLLPVRLGADAVSPQIFTDRKIPGFSVFHHRAFGIDVTAPVEQGVEKTGMVRGDDGGCGNALMLGNI